MDARKGGGRARPWVVSAAYEAAINAVIKARQDGGVSQRDLAARLGKPRSFISKIERRERRLDILEFVAIAKALDLEPEALIGIVKDALPDDLDF